MSWDVVSYSLGDANVLEVLAFPFLYSDDITLIPILQTPLFTSQKIVNIIFTAMEPHGYLKVFFDMCKILCFFVGLVQMWCSKDNL